MPILSCGCLNVQISVRGDLSYVRKTTIKHAYELPDSPEHIFFNGGVYDVELDLCGITFELEQLTTSFRLSQDQWQVWRCLCCDSITHATHDATATTAASPSLLDEAEMSILEQHERFSAVFRVVLPSDESLTDSTRPQPTLSTRLLPPTIQKQFSRYLRQTESACESRIGAFKKQQDQQLSDDTDQARRDSYTLLTLLSRREEEQTTTQSSATNGSIATQQRDDGIVSRSLTLGHAMPATLGQLSQSMAVPSDFSLAARGTSPPRYTISAQVLESLPPLRAVDEDIQEADLFQMSEDDSRPPSRPHTPQGYGTDDDDFDYRAAEEDDDTPSLAGYAIPGSTPRGVNVAQSVPIAIPINPNQRRRSRPKGEQQEPMKTEDICASIIAMSKSLHHYDEAFSRPLPKRQSGVHF